VKEPPGDTRICRFMDLPKFRDLFANEELYFRRTDLFKETDPNEALPSDEYARRVLRLERYDLNDELALNNDLAFARQVSESYFINCWQIFEGETLDHQFSMSANAWLRKPSENSKGRHRTFSGYCSFAYSALASFRMGMSGSASFQRVRKPL
jgi:hypothetical protein